MLKNIRRFVIGAIVATVSLISISSFAEESAVGLWKNIDDISGKPKALIRITEDKGVYSGKVEKLFRTPDQDQHPLCTKCEGANKDQPVLGMVILMNMKKEGDNYEDGTILDPNNGKVYKCKMKLEDNAKKLNVRGYIGMPLLGRTQTWLREE